MNASNTSAPAGSLVGVRVWVSSSTITVSLTPRARAAAATRAAACSDNSITMPTPPSVEPGVADLTGNTADQVECVVHRVVHRVVAGSGPASAGAGPGRDRQGPGLPAAADVPGRRAGRAGLGLWPRCGWPAGWPCAGFGDTVPPGRSSRLSARPASGWGARGLVAMAPTGGRVPGGRWGRLLSGVSRGGAPFGDFCEVAGVWSRSGAGCPGWWATWRRPSGRWRGASGPPGPVSGPWRSPASGGPGGVWRVWAGWGARWCIGVEVVDLSGPGAGWAWGLTPSLRSVVLAPLRCAAGCRQGVCPPLGCRNLVVHVCGHAGSTVLGVVIGRCRVGGRGGGARPPVPDRRGGGVGCGWRGGWRRGWRRGG